MALVQEVAEAGDDTTTVGDQHRWCTSEAVEEAGRSAAAAVGFAGATGAAESSRVGHTVEVGPAQVKTKADTARKGL